MQRHNALSHAGQAHLENHTHTHSKTTFVCTYSELVGLFFWIIRNQENLQNVT